MWRGKWEGKKISRTTEVVWVKMVNSVNQGRGNRDRDETMNVRYKGRVRTPGPMM